jgi:hypothetical protein
LLRAREGNNMAATIAMIAITTSNSTSENAGAAALQSNLHFLFRFDVIGSLNSVNISVEAAAQEQKTRQLCRRLRRNKLGTFAFACR